MARKTLGVVMPNYNDGAYIAGALKAVLSQARQPDQVVVVDDGSIDRSVEIVEGFRKSEPSLTLLRHARNQGTIAAVNHGLEALATDYVYFASANDVVLPGFFEKSMELLERYPDAGLCCSDPAILHPSGRILHERLGWNAPAGYLSPEQFADAVRKDWRRAGGGTSVLHRVAALKEAGGFSALGCLCDWFAYSVIGFRHGACYIPKALVAWRATSSSYGASIRNRTTADELVVNLLALLKSPQFRDVLPLFQRSGALSILPGILRVLVRHPEHHDCLTPLLISRAVPSGARLLLSNMTPAPLRFLYHRVRHRTIARLDKHGAA